jgi:hypothetical protein
MKVWICGQGKGDYATDPSRWELQGVFSSREAAYAACVSEYDFIYPVEMDMVYPRETTKATECEYPVIDRMWSGI